MSRLEDLSGEILMAILEYMDVEDVWRSFFHMNQRFHSLVFDSRLRLTADISRIAEHHFEQICQQLSSTNVHNIFTLVLSNNYYRYPQIRQFLFHTNFLCFQSLSSLTLIDINSKELMEISQQISSLNNLNHLHINTHEIFHDTQLANVTYTCFNQPHIRALVLGFHAKIQWHKTVILPTCNVEVLSLNFINIDHLLSLLPHCPQLRSLSMTLDSRPGSSVPLSQSILTFPRITHLCFYFRHFNVSVLEHLLTTFPSVQHFSIDTLVYNAVHIRAPFWTLLFQERLLFLERIRLTIRGWHVLKINDNIDRNQANLIDGYRCDRYWLERAPRNIFTCCTNNKSTVLQIR